MPSSGCPTLHVDRVSNANGFVYGTAVTGSPYTTGANMNAGSGVAYANPTTGDQLGRIDIAVAPSNPQRDLRAGAVDRTEQQRRLRQRPGCQLGVWATHNGGTSWTFMAGSQGPSPRAAAASTIRRTGTTRASRSTRTTPTASSSTPIDVWFATRTGITFTDVTCGYNGANGHVVHVDQHALAFVPGSSSILLIGSDGGAFATTQRRHRRARPRRRSFNMDNGLNTIEFYSGDISGNFATSPNPSAAGGAQDNGAERRSASAATRRARRSGR